jgi:predicted membrane protein
MLDTKRREFIALLGAGGLLLAVKVRRGRAQQQAMPVVGFLGTTSIDSLVCCRILARIKRKRLC